MRHRLSSPRGGTPPPGRTPRGREAPQRCPGGETRLVPGQTPGPRASRTAIARASGTTMRAAGLRASGTTMRAAGLRASGTTSREEHMI
jgi:hypothetical protein